MKENLMHFLSLFENSSQKPNSFDSTASYKNIIFNAVPVSNLTTMRHLAGQSILMYKYNNFPSY